jgi:hypothetical protein
MQSTSKKRPGLVWTIVLIDVFMFLFLALMSILIIRAWPKLPEATRAPLRVISIPEWVLAAVGLLLNCLGTLQLFRLKRSAFVFFFWGLVLGILGICTSLLLTDRPLGSYVSLSGLIGYAYGVFVCWYSWRLDRERILT